MQVAEHRGLASVVGANKCDQSGTAIETVKIQMQRGQSESIPNAAESLECQ